MQPPRSARALAQRAPLCAALPRAGALIASALAAFTLAEPCAFAEPAPVPEQPEAIPPPPPAESPPPGARTNVLLTGAGVFVGWYGIALGQSFLWKDAPYAEKLRIPVAGPWITVAHAGCSSGETNCTNILAVVRAVLAGISAVGQVGGLAVMAEGAFMRSGKVEPPKPSKASLFRGVSVVAGGDTVGVGLSGAF